MENMIIVLLAVFGQLVVSGGIEFESQTENHDALVSMGKIQYEVMKLDARMPRYGTCWTAALEQLNSGCKHLDDDMQSRLALSFANCFLEKAGMRTYPCDENTQISECIKNIDSNAYTTFANFFTHTQNMCYFLQSQVWKEATDQTIQRLAINSEAVSKSMEESHKLQDKILIGQQVTMEYQQQLIENGSVLSQALEVSKDNVKEMLAEFKHSTDEQRNLIFEVFDRVSRLQNLVVSEVNWLYTIVFYGASLMVIYIVTATKRTADARLTLFIILSLNLVCERMVCSYSLPSESNKIPTELSELVYQRIWWVRNLAIGLSVIIISAYILKYKDYNLINNSLLQEIKMQNSALQQSMQIFQVKNRTSYQQSNAFGDVLDGSLPASVYDSAAVSVLLNEDTGFNGDEDAEYDDDSDNDSFDSTRTDRSFDPGEFSDEDFETAKNSRETSGNITPTNDSLDNAMETLLSTRLAMPYPPVHEFTTPLKHFCRSFGSEQKTPYSSEQRLSSGINGGQLDSPVQILQRPPSVISSRRGPGRPSGSSRKARENCTPPDRCYNLRSRTPASGEEGNCSVGRVISPLLEETPEEFAKLVQAQLSKTQRTRLKWSMAVKRNNEQGYSSDDE